MSKYQDVESALNDLHTALGIISDKVVMPVSGYVYPWYKDAKQNLRRADEALKHLHEHPYREDTQDSGDYEITECYCNATSHPPCSYCENEATTKHNTPKPEPYICPQCGPDERGGDQHAWYAHTFDGLEGKPFKHNTSKEKLIGKSLTQSYSEIIDWNAKFIRKAYEPIGKTVLQPILDVIPDGWDLGEGHWLEGYLDFCPECGCIEKRGTENMASYPEAYYKTFCASCGFLLAIVDNSPCCIWYQYKENDFKVEI